MRTSDYDFALPGDLIAQRPPQRRGDSRMMVIHRASGQIEHRQFADFESFTEPGDLFVFNDTKVVPARFFSNDHSKEILRLNALSEKRWQCLVKPGKKMRTGHTIDIGPATGTVREVLANGDRIIEFDLQPDENAHGHLALPPYIDRPDDAADQSRYQTVFAEKEGAIAAPTAGLHFSEEIMARLDHVFVTLHVGLGTFRPVSVEEVSEHTMHRENFVISGAVASRIEAARRVIAIGTTVVRVLESCAVGPKRFGGQREGATDIFIYPPYTFKMVDGLLTNFHLPKSTLLMLVSAFASRELVLEAYQKAVENRYRFFSYGDCMLLL
jgi:S-adenosylmethionine:tRNA ribosyltransferase-isomerase